MTCLKQLHGLLLIVAGCLMTACYDKEEPVIPSTDEEEGKHPFVEVTDSTFTAPDAYADHICEENYMPHLPQVSKVLSITLRPVINSRIPKLNAIFQEESQAAGREEEPWHIKSFVFNYKSLSAKGEEILLSGRVTFPQYVNPELSHQLNSLSIVSHTYTPGGRAYPTQREDLMTPRILYNSAVIEPDYEGYGVTGEKVFCFLSNNAMAQQMADCVEAALVLLKQHHVTLADNGYSTCWGVSMGAPGILAFTRYYETLASDSFKQSIRLHSTLAASGPLATDQILEYDNQHVDHKALLLHLQMTGLEAIAPERLGGYTLKDFIPEWMLTTPYELEGKSYMYYDLWMTDNAITYYLSTGDSQMSQWQLADILAPDMLDDEGHLLDSSPKVQVLRRILAEENDWESWTPQTPTYLMHHPKDGGVPYEPSYQLYQSFASRGGNVFWKDDSLPFILESNPLVTHFCTGLFDIVRALSCEFPSEMSTTLQSIL